MQLRAHGYTRTSSRTRTNPAPEAGYATAPQDAARPPPRRSGLPRSLLLASALGAASGAALLVWDHYDPKGAAPVKSFAYQTLDKAIETYHYARDAVQPYFSQLTGSAPAPHAPQRASVTPDHHEPHATALAAEKKKEEEEEENRAKVILLEGVKQVQEEDDDDDDDDDIDKVVASTEDAATPTLATLSGKNAHVEAQPQPAHHEEAVQKQVADQAHKDHQEGSERHRTVVEEIRKREEERQLFQEDIDRRLKAYEEKEAADRAEREAKLAAATKERAEREAELRERKTAQDEMRKQALKDSIRRRHEELEKMRVAAIEAKHKREEAEAEKRKAIIPPRLLTPETAHKPAPIVHASEGPVAPALTVKKEYQNPQLQSHTPSPGERELDRDREAKFQQELAAAVEKTKREEHEKYTKLLLEKERLVARVHAAEAEAYATSWSKSMSDTFGQIAHEMASRKFMNSGDFAHLSAIFTGYISLKNALDKEQPFASELGSLKRAIHDDLAHQVIDSIPKTAAAGVPTLQRITTSFEQNLVPSVRQVAYTANDDALPMPLQHIRRTFAWYVLGSLRVKSPDEVTSTPTMYTEAERALAYTHEALNRGDLMSALQHIRRLPAGPVAEIGKAWAQGLHDRLVVEQATVIFDALIPPAK